jgi:hypothetical protein
MFNAGCGASCNATGAEYLTDFKGVLQWVFNGCKFNDRLMYATQQSKPAKGFMTSDYHRRDEFSLDFRTEQYRCGLYNSTPLSVWWKQGTMGDMAGYTHTH